MKNTKYLILTLGLFFFVSCSEDFLNEKPQVTVEQNTAITNEKTLAIAVAGLHDNIQRTGAYGALIPTLNELLADHSFVSLRNSNRFAGTRLTDLSYFVRQNGDITNLWNSLYNILANANFVLSFEGKIPNDLSTDGTPESLFAQTHAVRAMVLYDLVTHFSEAFGNSNQELGVPMPLSLDVNSKLPRSTVPQVYSQIQKDLTSAEGKILNKDKRLVTNSAVDLLFSRYYLAVKNYALADTYSQKVINSTASSFVAASNIFGVSNEANAETIFRLEFNDKDLPGANDGITATWYSGGRYRQNFATRAFYDKINSTDTRKNTWYKLTGVGSPSITAFPDNPKPVDVAKYTASAHDVILMRKSEAVFNQLEALYYTNPASALVKLNSYVTINRDPGYVFNGTGSELLNEILFQKNVELFLEGFRYRDLKRNNIGFTNPQTGVTLNPSKHQFKAFPIPLGEVLSNPNIVQFPDY